jgi:hypothetical protein
MPVTPLRFTCAKTVSELHLFEMLGLLFERKQIPRFVVNIRNSRKAMEPSEATRLPCTIRGLCLDRFRGGTSLSVIAPVLLTVVRQKLVTNITAV